MREDIEKIIEQALKDKLIGTSTNYGVIEDIDVYLSSHTCSRDEYSWGPPDCQTIEVRGKFGEKWEDLLE